MTSVPNTAPPSTGPLLPSAMPHWPRRAAYEDALQAKGYGPVTTEIAEAGPFYFAETHHQQYLAKNPHGYCGLGGTGVTCPIGVTVAA